MAPHAIEIDRIRFLWPSQLATIHHRPLEWLIDLECPIQGHRRIQLKIEWTDFLDRGGSRTGILWLLLLEANVPTTNHKGLHQRYEHGDLGVEVVDRKLSLYYWLNKVPIFHGVVLRQEAV